MVFLEQTPSKAGVRRLQMEKHLYYYQAFVEKVYDGDTVTCTVECGFGLSMRKQKIRLYGINCPEVRGPERENGLRSRNALRDKILHKTVVLKTKKDAKGKYGRYLGTLFLDGENVNRWLLAKGLAEEAFY